MVIYIRKRLSRLRLRAVLREVKPVQQKGFDTKKHLGKWRLTEDSLATQRRLRDEW